MMTRPERAGSVVETALQQATRRAHRNPDVALRLVRLQASHEAARRAWWYGALTGAIVMLTALVMASLLRAVP